MTWSIALRQRRNETIAQPWFQRWSARFWPTRAIARRNAKAAFDMATGFVHTAVLTACARLNVMAILAQGPMTAAQVAASCGLEGEAAEILLKAGVPLRLFLRLKDGRFMLDDLGAAMAADKGVEAMMRHHAILYRDLADPVAFLRGVNRPTELQRYWAYVRDGDPALAAPAEIADYSALMAATQSFIAETVLDAIDLRGVATLLDVAGGEGAFLTAAAARHRQLQLMLFDLPPVAERAERRFTESGFETRARTFGGSFLRDPLPQGAGAATLVRVLHDHDDAPAMTILKRIRAALPAGARLWIAEPMAGVRGAETAGDTYFGFYLKAMGSGRPRTPAEIIAMAKEAGFAHAKTVATAHPVFVSIVAATA